MKKVKTISLIFWVIICLISIVIMVFVLTRTTNRGKQVQFTPPPFEINAIQGIPSVPDELEWGEINTEIYRASICGIIVPEGNSADIWFVNPKSNSVWLKLRILDSQGNIIGETGIIKAGEYVQSVIFTSVPKEGDSIVLKVMAYEEETYYSAGSVILNTKVGGRN